MTIQKIKDYINERLQSLQSDIEWYDDEETNYAEEMTMRFLYQKHELQALLDWIEKQEKLSK